MTESAAGASELRRLFVYNAGFLTQPRIRRILTLAGYEVRLGKPGPEDAIGVWGQSPTSPRGESVARATGAPVVRVEDAFLRSLFPGRAGEPTLGLLIDETGVHFDASRPSDLKTLLATHPLDDPDLLSRAQNAITTIRKAHLTKFAATDPDLPVPEPGYVLVIDQSAGDASVTASQGNTDTFRRMLEAARDENPGTPIVIKGHPETAQNLRPGHYGPGDANDAVTLLTDPVSPWPLLEHATAVYTLSSGLGFEAILAGHTPQVFGTPFYAGWGLTHDRAALPDRRGRKLTPEQLFAAAMILYPKWYDPYRDSLGTLEDVMAALTAQAQAWREDRAGWVAHGMSRWKRPHMRAFFGTHGGITFGKGPRTARSMVWASKAGPEDADAIRVEDGFLRSRGLGASLTPPLSLVTDDLGIYYDPHQPSRLEALIAQSDELNHAEIARSTRLIDRICALGLSKYNISAESDPNWPSGPDTARRILVVGQVEDDASIRLGAGDVATNADLLTMARDQNQGARLLYKPHPDVEAGLRQGGIDIPEGVAVARDADPVSLIAEADEIWTMTSLLGFEALLRGTPVTVTGAPFYAGWGLTRDLGDIPARRVARPTVAGLVHAALIDYPRYRDPISGLPCPVEVIVDRLATDPGPGPSGLLAVLQALRGRIRRLF